uniref:Kelch-like protein n=1 Tax=Rhabditophanes sp. KR3021 TaxID=114890 RepID=A0AC35TGB0_9BILA
MTSLKGDYSSVVCSNKVYVIGGYLKDVASSLYTVEYFEPEKMAWIEAPELLKDVRFHDSVNVDENIYTIGGYRSSKFQRFDPREGVWSYLMYIPNQTYHSAVTSFGQTITCVGGGDRETNKSEIIHLQMSLNKYNYSSVVYSNKIYVIGGRGTRLIDTVEYFEPEKMTWINAPKLLTSVFCHDSVILDEIIYTIGDLNCNKFQRFDPRDGKWSYLTDIPIQTHFSAVSSFGQTITCAGGGSNYYKNLCQVYDIRNNTWSKIADLPERAYAASSFENEVSLIVSGGESDFIQKYNKKDKTWSILNIHLLVSNAYSSKVVL